MRSHVGRFVAAIGVVASIVGLLDVRPVLAISLTLGLATLATVGEIIWRWWRDRSIVDRVIIRVMVVRSTKIAIAMICAFFLGLVARGPVERIFDITLPRIPPSSCTERFAARSPRRPLPDLRCVEVLNEVTNGPADMREDSPAYLSTVTRNYCKAEGCMVPGTDDLDTGDPLIAVCAVHGDRTTNGEDGNARDDSNPKLYSSTLWYRVRHPNGSTGFISEVWLNPSDRGGVGLPSC